jgi:hypothetical protein
MERFWRMAGTVFNQAAWQQIPVTLTVDADFSATNAAANNVSASWNAQSRHGQR